MHIRHIVAALPPLVRQLLGAAGGAAIAVVLYVGFQYVPSVTLPIGLHGAADPAAAQEQKMQAVATQAQALLRQMEEHDAQMP